MHPKRKQRLRVILIILCGIAIAATLMLYALRQDISLYFTPSQVVNLPSPPQGDFRLGGIVKTGSIQRSDQGLRVNFILTDHHYQIKATYKGVLPDLFAAGRWAVIDGHLTPHHIFIADQVLAKHDATYKPRIEATDATRHYR